MIDQFLGKVAAGCVRIPGSKSLTNRALLVAALAKGESVLHGCLKCDDTLAMVGILKTLGVSIQFSEDQTIIQGRNGRFLANDSTLDVLHSGTCARFLAAALCLGQGLYHLSGSKRMCERPMGPLLQALRGLGCEIEALSNPDCLPLQIRGGRLRGGVAAIDSTVSSQFISALLLCGPYADQNLCLRLEGQIVSRTYIDMTLDLMARFGVPCEWQGQNILVQSGGYSGQVYHIDGDASSASYFFAAAAITQGDLIVEGVQKDGNQGDLQFLDLLKDMGCLVEWQSDDKVRVVGRELQGIQIEMTHMSDVAPTLAVCALFAKGKTRVTGIENMRLKECDRIYGVVSQLSKLGADITEFQDGFEINGMVSLKGGVCETFDDHRMAMAFSLIALKVPGVEIEDPKCVSKTFPNYFKKMSKVLAIRAGI